eukprot:gb/GFBE01036861.1/.p1 GENE.gb/GFBE01036861.1/~~gb/GFBE01036861.1/.p1  ORF type:complete len:569 (+),score=100.07 gb/GFBE01036861.1/:1-1707(+)
MGCSSSAVVAKQVLVEGILIEDRRSDFTTLLEAFQACYPDDLGMLRDSQRLATVSAQLVSSRSVKHGGLISLPQLVRPMSFPDFVNWAVKNGVILPLGLPETPQKTSAGVCFPLPGDWEGPMDDFSWNKRAVVDDGKLLFELQDLLDISYRKIWTRDRKATGINRVPAGYKLEYALCNQNYRQWYAYFTKRHQLSRDCCKTGAEQFSVLTGASEQLCERHQLQGPCNEWLVFHGTDATSAESICTSGFRMSLAGSNTGSLYGKGAYCAESITKADEYARADADGLCCTLVCRLAGGRVLYTSEDAPDVSKLQAQMHANSCNTVLGDRTTTKKTFREFVFYDEDQVYVEYVLFYRRVFRDRGGTTVVPSATPEATAAPIDVPMAPSAPTPAADPSPVSDSAAATTVADSDAEPSEASTDTPCAGEDASTGSSEDEASIADAAADDPASVVSGAAVGAAPHMEADAMPTGSSPTASSCHLSTTSGMWPGSDKIGAEADAVATLMSEGAEVAAESPMEALRSTATHAATSEALHFAPTTSASARFMRSDSALSCSGTFASRGAGTKSYMSF